MLVDSPADPRDYPWRTTWMPSITTNPTLALFATNFREENGRPRHRLATYGAQCSCFRRARFPMSERPRLDFADTLEERMLAAGCLHSHHRHIALLSYAPPERLEADGAADGEEDRARSASATSARKRFSSCASCTF